MRRGISILWKNNPKIGEIQLTNSGVLVTVQPAGNPTPSNGHKFTFEDGACLRLNVTIADANTRPGPKATIVHVKTEKNRFSFFLRDVNEQSPVYIEEYGVAVTNITDTRSYIDIVSGIEAKGLNSALEALRYKPEASFEKAAEETRNLRCLTIHGIARDIRVFEAGFTATNTPTDSFCWIAPRNASFTTQRIHQPHTGRNTEYQYEYVLGKGMGCVNDIVRWNEQDVLPIINACYAEEEMKYNLQLFCTYEKTSLTPQTVRGIHHLVAAKHMGYGSYTDAQMKIADELTQPELYQSEQTVAYLRIDAVNHSDAPKYCYLKAPTPNVFIYPNTVLAEITIDSETGLGYYGKDEVFLAGTIDGEPLTSFEISQLVPPRGRVRFEFKIPHTRVDVKRGMQLALTDYDQKLAECKDYWNQKLSRAAKIELPEKRIEQMVKTALLHFDMLSFGKEPDGPLAAGAGITYNPIGSESSPIIQFFDSMGLHDHARRCLMFFINNQRETGEIHCYESYTLETGFVLWTIGEHFRYTGDTQWVRSIKDNIISACDYISRWIDKNKTDSLIGRGYGMIDGKVADPVDPYHGYMLNAGAYIGLRRSAEVLSAIGNEQAGRINQLADELYKNIRKSVEEGFAKAPVVPLGNGKWVPTLSPWPEDIGPVSLYADGKMLSPIGITLKDSLLGVIYLLFLEIIGHNELYGDFIMRFHNELYTMHNTCFVQPYYSPHPYSNLRRGETEAFLEEYYYNVSAHADRETYAFWEGYNHTSPYKSHEQAWFMMRTRWMLYYEEDSTLKLLSGIPRKWMAANQPLVIKGAKCYFGAFDLSVIPNLRENKIQVAFQLILSNNMKPDRILIRIPHPHKQTAVSVSAGDYFPSSETVVLQNFDGPVVFEITY